MISKQEIESPIGTLIACATDEGICLMEFQDKASLQQDLAGIAKTLDSEIAEAENEHLFQLKIELEEYFKGHRKLFSVPLILVGTDFQKNVWLGLQTITYGKTRTYKEQAMQLNSPNSIRAVASANGRNKLYILIPCHRVIGAQGSLTGYGSGLWRKQFLLDLESGSVSNTLF